MPGISVIIPVKNGGATLERCLQSIVDQTLADDLEIIVLNSMSTDNSMEIAQRFNAKIIDIPVGTFNHGLTRNTGIQHAGCGLIYLTVQDAWIPKNDMLEKMAKHFDDAKVMAVSGHQAIPHEKDKNPFFWYRPWSAPQVTERFVTNNEAFKNLPVNEQQSLVSWDNVVSMYRKSALIQQPFVKTEFSEDWVWSYQALLKGWKLLYDSSLVVYHYHHHSYNYAFNIAYATNYHFYKFFKYKPSLPALVMPMSKATYHLLKNKKLSLREKLYWIMHNWSGRLANYFSTINFLIRFKTGGENSIEKGYSKYCKVIPQGKQKV
jgi:rhamnosyltransferase